MARNLGMNFQIRTSNYLVRDLASHFVRVASKTLDEHFCMQLLRQPLCVILQNERFAKICDIEYEG